MVFVSGLFQLHPTQHNGGGGVTHSTMGGGGDTMALPWAISLMQMLKRVIK